MRRIALGLAISTASTVLSVAVLLFAGRALGYFATAEAALLFPPHSTFESATSEFHYRATVNSLGFRGPELRERRVRVMTLGDSFTFGWGVNDDEPWPRVLERLLGEDVEVVNLGKSGANPPDYEVIADAAVPFLRPDLVVVGLLQMNDVGAALVPPSASPIVPRGWLDQATMPPPSVITAEDVRAEWQGIAERIIAEFTSAEAAKYASLDPEIRALFESGRLEPTKIRRITRDPEAPLRLMAVPPTEEARTLEAAAAAHLSRVREIAEAQGATVLAVSVPVIVSVLPELRGSIRMGFVQLPWLASSSIADDQAQRIADAAGVPLVVVTDEVRRAARERELYFPLDAHFTAAGHTTFAEAIAPSVRDALDTRTASR